MNEHGSPPPARLDSWKAIADYLGRDVATVRRWERLHKLPVRRIAGPGRSVFAYVSEVDQWLRAMPSADVAPETEAAATSSTVGLPPSSSSSSSQSGRWLLAAMAVLVVSGLLWTMPLLTAKAMPIRAEMNVEGIVAFGKSGTELWRYPFSAEDRISAQATYADVRVMSGSSPGVLGATAYYEQFDKTIRSGQLLWLTLKGAPARAFSFDDQLEFRGASYAEPWVISDFSVTESGGERLIAVTARQNQWWPSLVTVLDGQWTRKGTFTNAGWVNQVQWLSSERLLVSGYSNATDHEGGMVGLIDVRTMQGQAPPSADPVYQCPSCGPSVAVRYVVLPRSEVNQRSGASLNGAVVQVQKDRVVARTVEVQRNAESVEAFYEFTPSLELVRASYGDRYWEMHRTLEAEGRITHTREQCPYRDGPQGVKVWDAQSGWRTFK